MPVIYISELDKVDAAAEKALANEVAENDAVKTLVESFVSESAAKLEGNAWDKERSRFNLYVEAMKKRSETAPLLLSTIKEANKMLRDYANDFPWASVKSIPNVNIPNDASLDMIDTAWLGELRTALSNANSAIETARSKMINTSGMDQSSEEYQDAVESNGNQSGIIGQATAIADACNTLIAYLERLPEVDKQAYAKYEEVNAKINELKTKVSEVENLFASPVAKTPKVVYVPVGGGGTPGTTDDTSNINGETDTTTDESTTTTEEPTTETPSESSTPNTVYVSTINQGNSTESTTEEVEPEGEILDDEFLDEEVVDGDVIDENLDIPPEDNVDNEPVKPSEGTKRKGSVAGKVALGLTGAAIAGAAGYGAYKTIQKSKENNDFDFEEEDEEYDDDEFVQDDGKDVEINLDNNDDI